MTYHKVDEGNYFITENDFVPPEIFNISQLMRIMILNSRQFNIFCTQNEGEKNFEF